MGILSMGVSDSSTLERGRAYPYLDGYWGERAELVYDAARVWVRAEFRPRDSVRQGKVISGGWDHEHCRICWEKISESTQPFGYHDQDEDWVCESCYEKYVTTKSIDFITAT